MNENAMERPVRNKVYTLEELRAIKEDLKEAGFIKSDRSGHFSQFSGKNVQTIEFQVKIKGAIFTIAEIDELAAQLATI